MDGEQVIGKRKEASVDIVELEKETEKKAPQKKKQ
jgi:hypothetical protein